jgi:hypothetical protein
LYKKQSSKGGSKKLGPMGLIDSMTRAELIMYIISMEGMLKNRHPAQHWHRKQKRLYKKSGTGKKGSPKKRSSRSHQRKAPRKVVPGLEERLLQDVGCQGAND